MMSKMESMDIHTSRAWDTRKLTGVHWLWQSIDFIPPWQITFHVTTNQPSAGDSICWVYPRLQPQGITWWMASANNDLLRTSWYGIKSKMNWFRNPFTTEFCPHTSSISEVIQFFLIRMLEQAVAVSHSITRINLQPVSQ